MSDDDDESTESRIVREGEPVPISPEPPPPDNVRALRPNTGGARVRDLELPEQLRQGTIVRRSFGLRGWCPHRETLVDAEARLVVCRACDAELDPYDVLGTVAYEWERLASAIRERRELEAALAKLREEASRLKARTREAKRRAPAADGELAALRRLESATRAHGRISASMTKALIALDEIRESES